MACCQSAVGSLPLATWTVVACSPVKPMSRTAPPAGGDDVSVPGDDQAVRLDVRRGLDGVEEGRDAGGVDVCADGVLTGMTRSITAGTVDVVPGEDQPMRRMRNPAFRDAQRAHLRDDHVAPVNALVDELATRGRGWVPHVAPVHGGTGAGLLWVARDPGPKVVDPENENRGFLCIENDDPTAARVCELLEVAGIGVRETMPWNAYPWYMS